MTGREKDLQRTLYFNVSSHKETVYSVCEIIGLECTRGMTERKAGHVVMSQYDDRFKAAWTQQKAKHRIGKLKSYYPNNLHASV